MTWGGHEHGHGAPGAGTAAQRTALSVSLALNAGLVVAELVAGLAFGSLALLADAGHALSDVGALALALVAIRLAVRPASTRHSYGLQRAELLAALGNGVALVLVALWVIVEAVQRIGSPPEVSGVGVLVVAAIGLGVNSYCAWLLARAGTENLNVRGALLHLLADALGSVGALVAGLAIVLWGAAWVDPAASLLIAGLILVSVWGLLSETVHVLLEGTPKDLHPEDVATALHAEPAVARIHHLHVWQLSSGSVALSAHVVARDVQTLHEAEQMADRLKRLLATRFGIDHATLEVECHDCGAQQIVAPEELRRP